MKYLVLILLKFVIILSFEFWATGIAWGQQSEKYRLLEKDKSAEIYLQKGHQANRNGNIDRAIIFYKKALDVAPYFRPAKLSLKHALNKLKIQKWALKMPLECRSVSQPIDTNVSIKCAEEYFSFSGQPIHPKIIDTLSTSLSDSGDQIVAVNLYDSQHSNRFCCESDIRIRQKIDTSENQSIYISEDNQEFGYQYMGKTGSGIHILHTYSSGGGSGIFKNIMLIIIESDYGIVFDSEKSIIRTTRPRLLLKKLGEVVLGDRWAGDLKVDGNNIFIGKDIGPFSNRTADNNNSVIKIDTSR